MSPFKRKTLLFIHSLIRQNDYFKFTHKMFVGDPDLRSLQSVAKTFKVRVNLCSVIFFFFLCVELNSQFCVPLDWTAENAVWGDFFLRGLWGNCVFGGIARFASAQRAMVTRESSTEYSRNRRDSSDECFKCRQTQWKERFFAWKFAVARREVRSKDPYSLRSKG